MKTPFLPNEHLQKESLANCQRGLDAVGGCLYCTDQRLIFESHNFNFQNGVTILELSQIVGSRPVWTKFLGIPIAPNSFEVQLKEGTTQSFVVRGRVNWMATIDQLRTGAMPEALSSFPPLSSPHEG